MGVRKFKKKKKRERTKETNSKSSSSSSSNKKVKSLCYVWDSSSVVEQLKSLFRVSSMNTKGLTKSSQSF